MFRGFDLIFDAFEKLINDGYRSDLEQLNDRNISLLLQAMNCNGKERECLLLKHALDLCDSSQC